METPRVARKNPKGEDGLVAGVLVAALEGINIPAASLDFRFAASVGCDVRRCHEVKEIRIINFTCLLQVLDEMVGAFRRIEREHRIPQCALKKLVRLVDVQADDLERFLRLDIETPECEKELQPCVTLAIPVKADQPRHDRSPKRLEIEIVAG